MAGLAVVIGTSSPAAAAELAGLVDARLVLRIADPSLAATLAASAGDVPGRRGAVGSVPVGGVPAGVLLSLGPGEFVLAVNEPTRRLVALGRLVPARLPRPAARPGAPVAEAAL